MSSGFVRVLAQEGKQIRINQELLLNYSTASTCSGSTKANSFWKRSQNEAEHCLVCYCKHTDVPLVQCEGDDGKCRVSRHTTCFSEPLSADELRDDRFYCEQHLPTSLRSASQIVKTAPPSLATPPPPMRLSTAAAQAARKAVGQAGSVSALLPLQEPQLSSSRPPLAMSRRLTLDGVPHAVSAALRSTLHISRALSDDDQAWLATTCLDQRTVVDAQSAAAVLRDALIESRVAILRHFPAVFDTVYSSVDDLLARPPAVKKTNYCFSEGESRAHYLFMQKHAKTTNNLQASMWWAQHNRLRDTGGFHALSAGISHQIFSRRAYSALHYDEADGVNSQIVGRKLWVLVKREEAELHGLKQLQHDSMREKPISGFHALSAWQACKSFQWCILSAGETIVLPRDRLHAVSCIGAEDSISGGIFCWLDGTAPLDDHHRKVTDSRPGPLAPTVSAEPEAQHLGALVGTVDRCSEGPPQQPLSIPASASSSASSASSASSSSSSSSSSRSASPSAVHAEDGDIDGSGWTSWGGDGDQSSDSSSSARSSDSDSQSDCSDQTDVGDRVQALARRVRGPAPTIPVAACAASLRPAFECPPLTLRTKAQVEKLISTANQERLSLTTKQAAEIDVLLAEAKEHRHWCMRQQRPQALTVSERGKSKRSRCDSSNIQADDGPQPMDIDIPEHSQARPAAVRASESSHKANRWRSHSAIAEDWAEYRSCCGQTHLMARTLSKLQTGAAAQHSSISVVSMFRVRLGWRTNVSSLLAFNNWVQELLSFSSDGRVQCEGGSICVSCFRAVLGVGRTKMFSVKKALARAVVQTQNLTSVGKAFSRRPADQLEAALKALDALISSLGQSSPVARSSNLANDCVYLPYLGVGQLLKAVNDHCKSADPTAREITMSTLQRARAAMTQRGVTISLVKDKAMCRCTDCTRLDNERLTAQKANNHAGVLAAEQQKDAHLKEVKEQRQLFEQKKKEALRHPSQLWTITFDGMDQAKTKLPSRRRYAKDLEPLPRLGVHTVGAYCFGAPVPVVGLLNYPDVRKDANYSCSALMRLLEIQWEALEKRCAAEADGSTPGDFWPKRLHLTFDNAASEAKNQVMFRMLGLLVRHRVFEAITVSTLIVGHTHDIVDQMFSVWARMLRIYQPSTGEQMRKLFAERYHSRVVALVQLLRNKPPPDEAQLPADAPHTMNDLVSEEAAALPGSQLDAASIEKARQKSAQDMEGHIQLLADLQVTMPHVEFVDRSLNFSMWFATIAASKANCLNGLPSQSESAAAQPVGQAVPQSAAVQRHSVDEITGKKAKKANSKVSAAQLFPRLQHITVPHVFAVEMDQCGVVWLYNKFLAKSTEVSQGEGGTVVQHYYRGQKTGDYTTRMQLWAASDCEHTAGDPLFALPQRIDAQVLRQTVALFHKEKDLTHDEVAELTTQLQRFDVRMEQLNAQCTICAAYVCSLAAIGVVSNKKTATQEEKQAARLKSNSRNSTKHALDRHLMEQIMSGSGSHEFLRAEGVMSVWVTQRSDVIVAGLIRRGLQVDPAYAQPVYSFHPNKLCSGRGEKPITVEAEGDDAPDHRVDVQWLMHKGAPAEGQLVFVRSDEWFRPFWVGRVLSLLPRSQVAEAKLSLEDAAASAKDATAAHQPSRAAGQTDTRSSKSAAASASRHSGNSTRPARAAAAQRAAMIEAESDSDVDEQNQLLQKEVSDDDDGESRQHNSRRGKRGRSASVSAASNPAPTKRRVHFQSAASSRASSRASSCERDSQLSLEAASPGHTSKSDSDSDFSPIADEPDVSSNTGEPAREPFRSEHGGVQLPAWGKAHAGDVRRQKTKQLRAATQLKQLPSMQIEWFDTAREHSRLKLGDEQEWRRKQLLHERKMATSAVAATGGDSESDPALSTAAAASAGAAVTATAMAAHTGADSQEPEPVSADRALGASRHNVVPAWILDVWDKIAFLPCNPPHIDYIHPEQLIVWGDEVDVLTSKKRVAAHIRKRVREDLMQPPVGATLPPTTARASS